jgi:hypothetical protein
MELEMNDLSPKEAERRPERREIRDVLFERHSDVQVSNSYKTGGP